MAEYHLTGPLSEADVRKLRIGDTVYLSGEVFTCRSRLQKYIFDEEHTLPFSTEDRNILIHGRRYFTESRFPVGDKFLEPVWHRATLDLMAALSLMGSHRFAGTVVSYRAGHTLDCDAVRALYRNDLLCCL